MGCDFPNAGQSADSLTTRTPADVMSLDAEGRRPVFLEPGDFHFGAAPLRIATLLGSCVTVTLWHPRRRIGGMCHCQLPARRRPIATLPDGRFVDEAFELFDQELRRCGLAPNQFIAKLFGGGCMFAAASTMMDVGRRNIEAAEAMINARHIPLLARHVGGGGRRKLLFDLASGEVWLQYREGNSNDT